MDQGVFEGHHNENSMYNGSKKHRKLLFGALGAIRMVGFRFCRSSYYLEISN